MRALLVTVALTAVVFVPGRGSAQCDTGSQPSQARDVQALIDFAAAQGLLTCTRERLQSAAAQLAEAGYEPQEQASYLAAIGESAAKGEIRLSTTAYRYQRQTYEDGQYRTSVRYATCEGVLGFGMETQSVGGTYGSLEMVEERPSLLASLLGAPEVVRRPFPDVDKDGTGTLVVTLEDFRLDEGRPALVVGLRKKDFEHWKPYYGNYHSMWYGTVPHAVTLHKQEGDTWVYQDANLEIALILEPDGWHDGKLEVRRLLLRSDNQLFESFD